MAVILMAKKGKAGEVWLRARRVVDVPLREVSGICSRRVGDRQTWLIAIGDREAKLAWASLPRDAEGSLDWNILDIARLPGSELPARDPQIEAVGADGAGRVLLLQERPHRAEVVDLRRSRVLASIRLSVGGRGELARSWSDPDGSGGEGVVLLPGGRLLIAKEKHPAALIEFGPPGSRSRGLAQRGALSRGSRWPIAEGSQDFVARACWLPDATLAKACADFSDLEVGPDGRLYLLSDKSASIARIGPLAPGGGKAALDALWRLDELDGKPEGLSFTTSGHAIVALDRRKARRNLVLLEPAIALPRSTSRSSGRTRTRRRQSTDD